MKIWKTPQFKAWFRDSKVTDENGHPLVGHAEPSLKRAKRLAGTLAINAAGEPLVLYHGTCKAFDEFDATGDVDSGEVGVFFTTNRESTAEYTDGEGGRVILVNLVIERPYEVTVEQWARAEGLSPLEARESGFDSYVIRGQDGGDTYIAFSAEQILQIGEEPAAQCNEVELNLEDEPEEFTL